MTYNDKPAILGGNKVFNADFKPLNYINVEERDAALRVIDSKNLSGFVANWPEGFLGGPEVLNLEKNWENKFRVKYAVSMNSATSCLMAALGAIEIEPGDEVLVTPVTMTATSAAILIYNAIPVFVVFACLGVIKTCLTPFPFGRLKPPSLMIIDAQRAVCDIYKPIDSSSHSDGSDDSEEERGES